MDLLSFQYEERTAAAGSHYEQQQQTSPPREREVGTVAPNMIKRGTKRDRSMCTATDSTGRPGLSLQIRHACSIQDVGSVGRALMHRMQCNRDSCTICSSVDNLMRQVRDHKRNQCPGQGCNFCRKWNIVKACNKKRLVAASRAFRAMSASEA
jgi:hypothetical protein